MSLYKGALYGIKRKRIRKLTGLHNCIPWGYKRFEREIPGLEQKHYYLVSGNEKSGKTTLTDDLFLHRPYEFCRKNTNTRVKGLYFSLEISKEKKILQTVSRKLWNDSSGKDRFTIRDLESKTKALPESVYNKLHSDEYLEYFEDFLDKWYFVTNVYSSKGILKYIEKFAESRGTWKEVEVSGKKEKKFLQTDEDEYIIVIIDHATLLVPSALENKSGGLRSAINNLSKGLLRLRDTYGITPVLVQQQAKIKQANESFKLGRLRPSIDGLAECKSTINDVETMLGIFSPFAAELMEYPEKNGYDIPRFKDHLRFLDIVRSRDGGAGNLFPLFFDGGPKIFFDMPSPSSSKIDEILNYLSNHNLV
jgi:KaiC/GvpD/RAD55 family RecA-like ATPase